MDTIDYTKARRHKGVLYILLPFMTREPDVEYDVAVGSYRALCHGQSHHPCREAEPTGEQPGVRRTQKKWKKIGEEDRKTKIRLTQYK